MSPLARLLIVVAALLAGASAHIMTAKPGNDGSCSMKELGSIVGNDVIVLPKIHVSTGVSVGFVDNCEAEYKILMGTRVIACNEHGTFVPHIVAVNDRTPLSDVTINCRFLLIFDKCPKGVELYTTQYCKDYPIG